MKIKPNIPKLGWSSKPLGKLLMNPDFQTQPWAHELRISEGRVQGICVFSRPREYLATFGNLTLSVCTSCSLLIPIREASEGVPLRNQCVHSIVDSVSPAHPACSDKILLLSSWEQERRLSCSWISHWPSPNFSRGPREHLEGFHLWKKWDLESMNYSVVLEGVLTLGVCSPKRPKCSSMFSLSIKFPQTSWCAG